MVQRKTNNFNNLDKNLFLENYYKEPDIHIVFKEKYLKKFNEKIFPTSDKSAFLHNRKY